MQSVGTHQYNTSNSQQPHNHPTPQSPPGLYSASSGFNTSMNSQKITSPKNNTHPLSANSLPTPRSPTLDATQSSNMEDAMDVDGASSLKRRRSQGDLGDDDRPRKSRSRSRDPMEIDDGQQPTSSSLSTARPRKNIPTMEEFLAMPPTGPPSWLNLTKHVPQRPSLTSNLIELYGLTAIAASVARTDSSGQKQKLRKSYKGKIAGLSGKNEVVTKAEQIAVREGEEGWGQPVVQLVKGGLLEMLDIPEDEWRSMKVVGKELPRNGIGGRQLDYNALRKGLSNWTKGPVPDYDASWLALEDPPPRSSATSASGHPTTNSALNNVKSNTPIATASPNGVNTSSPNPVNMRSSGRKRRREYGDVAWEGYGEDVEEDGGSGYDDDGKRKKKRKIPDYDDGRVGGVGMDSMPVNRAHAVGVGGGYYQR
ncbi:hypothetical protein TWF730_004303 [Orbilia blumenaviensis]|uniref:Mediator of RNA polymerase II transcription subunit 19 n=1 Tax=Orbilia blumenaviensis TaxID=1796055 RepID=A0AAV9U2F4_9PEZI